MARRCSDDIEPAAEDVGTSACRTANRARPEPPDALKAAKAKTLARVQKRPLSPGVMYERDDGRYRATSPHSDLDLWELQIADAFGTRSKSVCLTFITSLKALCSQSWDEPNNDWKPNERELNAALAMVADQQPRNVMEASLAAQMVAVHLMTMRVAAQALNRGHTVLDRDAALAGKLARTFTMQVDAMQAMKGKRRTTRQSIKVTKEVNQHVHYHDHRGAGESDGQPHAPDGGSIDGRAALPGPDQGGEVVRLPVRSRKAAV